MLCMLSWIFRRNLSPATEESPLHPEEDDDDDRKKRRKEKTEMERLGNLVVCVGGIRLPDIRRAELFGAFIRKILFLLLIFFIN